MRQSVLCVILLVGQLSAETIRTDWAGLQRQVEAVKLAGRPVEIRLTSGKKIKNKKITVTDGGIETGSQRIAKDEIGSVRFEKQRNGRRALLGAAIGAGSGAGIAAAATSNVDTYEGPAVLIVPGVIAATAIGGAVIGYLVGRGGGSVEFILR
jgi:hypothetical protein